MKTEVRRGEAAEEILKAAREAKADVIAMTTHGRTGLGRLLFGSVAETVLRESELPVLLMRWSEADVARLASSARATATVAKPGAVDEPASSHPSRDRFFSSLAGRFRPRHGHGQGGSSAALPRPRADASGRPGRQRVHVASDL